MLLRRRHEVEPGMLTVRLARHRREVAQAQALRYRVFHQQMGAASSLKHKLLRRDLDRYDRRSDHLLVIAPKRRRLAPHISGVVVGAYRLMRSDGAVIDRNFNTTDVCVVLPTSEIKTRYLRRFGPQMNGVAAA